MKTFLNASLGAFLLCSGLLCVAVHGEEFKTHFERALAAESKGEYQSARAFYEQATRENPTDAEVWAAYGEHIRFYVHDFKKAADAFRKALACGNNSRAVAYAWRGLGELERKEQRDDAAIKYFQKSLEALPLADTHRSLCHLYCRQLKFKEAAEQAGAAVKLNPDDAIARMLYAAQLHRTGDAAEARRQYEAALIACGCDLKGDSATTVHCCVVYNAAGYLSVAGDKEMALKMLSRFFATPNHRHLTRKEIEEDADFETLKNTPAFLELLDKAYPTAPAK